MSYDYSKISIKEIGEILPKLSRQQIMELDQRIHDFLETSLLTKASETAFLEWEDPEEDIYNADV
jgi:hypothetical protein